MNILFCYMYLPYGIGPKQSSADGVVRAFKSLGHNIVTCGPTQGNFSDNLLPGHDIPVYDRLEHPETYTYDEIVGTYLMKYGYKPDLIVQTDPHFYLIGTKPKDIKSVYWVADPHRGPTIFRRMAIEGNFDKIFISQKYYMPVFQRVGLNCEYLPRGYDDEMIYEHPEIDIQCDISFIGNTGLPDQNNWFNPNPNYDVKRDEELNLRYLDLSSLDLLPNELKFGCWESRSMEYAERTEHLFRLSKDFNIRIYQSCYDLKKMAKVLSRGKIGFNCSLRRDITIRVFEIPAVNRLLLTDEIHNLAEIMTDNIHLRTYRPYYQPQFAGFDLDYEEVKELVEYYLENEDERKQIAKQGMLHVQQNHTFKNRVKKMLERI